MTFKEAAILGSYISKDYAEDLLKLLGTYQSISASEAASRLNLHIKTVQDFLEAMFGLGILEREEVYEKKRPYYRYRLKVKKIILELDLSPLLPAPQSGDRLFQKIRERKEAGARFTLSRDSQYISNVVIWFGEGRDRTERRINLSIPQGKFLFHLPFPTAEFKTIGEIMIKSGTGEESAAEILDIVEALAGFGVIEREPSP